MIMANYECEEKVKELLEKEDGFILVQPKHRKKRKGKAGQTFQSNFHKEDLRKFPEKREETEERGEVIKKVRNCAKILEESSYYSTLVEELETGLRETGVETDLEGLQILCLGLGPFSSFSLIDLSLSRFQLALLVLLKKQFDILVEVFDPIFMPQEISILTEEFGFVVTEENKEGKYFVESPTLVFLPHCPHNLVNNFLQNNWNSDSLKHCYILSNSLSNIALHNPSGAQDPDLCYIIKSQSFCTELLIKTSFKENPKAFNGLALHWFSSEGLTNL